MEETSLDLWRALCAHKTIRTLLCRTGLLYMLGLAGEYILGHSMLAEIVDYEALHSGQRREGAMLVVEGNLNKAVGIVANSIPGLIFSTLGFRSNGGCLCGCGVKCAHPFERWHCDSDIGYACSGKMNAANAPFYGQVPRPAPCTEQQPVVNSAILVLQWLVPAVFALASALVIAFAPIDSAAHEGVLVSIRERKEGMSTVDPVTNVQLEPMPPVSTMYVNNILGHFTRSELAEGVRWGVAQLRSLLWFKVALTSILAASLLLSPMAFVHSQSFANYVTGATMAATLSVMLLGWHVTRMLEFRRREEFLADHIHGLRKEIIKERKLARSKVHHITTHYACKPITHYTTT